MNRKNVLDETSSAISISIFILPYFFGLWLKKKRKGHPNGNRLHKEGSNVMHCTPAARK